MRQCLGVQDERLDEDVVELVCTRKLVAEMRRCTQPPAMPILTTELPKIQQICRPISVESTGDTFSNSFLSHAMKKQDHESHAFPIIVTPISEMSVGHSFASITLWGREQGRSCSRRPKGRSDLKWQQCSSERAFRASMDVKSLPLVKSTTKDHRSASLTNQKCHVLKHEHAEPAGALDGKRHDGHLVPRAMSGLIPAPGWLNVVLAVGPVLVFFCLFFKEYLPWDGYGSSFQSQSSCF